MIYNDLFTVKKIKAVLSAQNIRPRRNWGQNFLFDRNIVDKIIAGADLSKEDQVIEVGAGLGVLTLPLAKASKKVVAYEIDKRLTPILRQMLDGLGNVKIIEGDVLKNNQSYSQNYKVVGSLPYNIAARIFRQYLTSRHPPKSIIAVVQKEVGERVCALQPHSSVLSLSVQFFGNPEILFKISRNSFWPKPNVDSVALRINLKKDLPSLELAQSFFPLIKAGFSSRRKFLQSNLRAKFGHSKEWWQEVFKKLKLPLKIRAQELHLEQWIELAKEL